MMRMSDSLKIAGRPIAYYPKLAKPLGGVNAAILFGHFFYWDDKTENPMGVYKTANEIEFETGLSVQEQRTARAKLRERGVLIETEKRVEHRIYYKLDMNAFDELMIKHSGSEESTFPKYSINIPELQNQHSGSEESTAVIRTKDYNNRLLQNNNIFVDSSGKTQIAEHYSFVDADATTTSSDGNLFDSEQQTEQAGNHSLKTNNERGTDGNSSGRNKDSNIPPAADEGNEKRFRAVAEVFNRVFADCPAVRKVSLKSVAANKKRKRLIPAAWAIAKDRVMTGWVDSDGLVDGEKVSAKHLLQWFEAYFSKCLEDPFINGQQPRSKGHENWKPDFETLLRPAEMEKRVYED